MDELFYNNITEHLFVQCCKGVSMKSNYTSPFDECPIYESQFFSFQLIKESDAKSLLSCYLDPKSTPLFNSDHCNCDFVCHHEEEHLKLIQFWLMEYNNRGYVRLGVTNKKSQDLIGTIEIYSNDERDEFIGHLRLDLASKYETALYLNDVFYMIDCYFKDDFKIDAIVTKVIPEATTRLHTLIKKNLPLNDSAITSYDNYHIKRWS